MLERDRSFSKGEVLMAGSRDGPEAETGESHSGEATCPSHSLGCTPTSPRLGVSFQGTKSSGDKSQALPECLLNLQAKLKFRRRNTTTASVAPLKVTVLL